MNTFLAIYAALLGFLFIHYWLYKPSLDYLDSGVKKEKGTGAQVVAITLPIILLAVFVRVFAMDYVSVPSGSMEPAIKKETRIFVNRLAFGLRSPMTFERIIGTGVPKRGDVIVARLPRNPETFIVKRVVAIPGDHLQIKDKKIYLNNKLLTQTSTLVNGIFKEKWSDSFSLSVKKTEASAFYSIDVELKRGEYFLLGDNRDDSIDSRDFGPILDMHLIGTAIINSSKKNPAKASNKEKII